MGVSPRRPLGEPLRRDVAAGLVRDMIADGTLLPDAVAPSAAELARKTGFSSLTCRAALRALLKDGTLTHGASPTARLRVAAPPGSGAPRSALREALSAALAQRRHAAGLTQPELATLVGMSVTTVGHAETGRTWQARHFWADADLVLGARGALLRLYDEYQTAADGPAEDPPEPPVPPDPPAPVILPVSVTITPDGVAVVWPDGSESVARPPCRPG